MGLENLKLVFRQVKPNPLQALPLNDPYTMSERSFSALQPIFYSHHSKELYEVSTLK